MAGLSFRFARTRGATDETFSQRKPVRKLPKDVGVLDLLGEDILSGSGIMEPSWVQIHPFAVGRPGSEYGLRVWGWTPVEDADIYIPLLLVEATIGLGPIDGGLIGDDVFMADTIRLVDGTPPLDAAVAFSNGNGLPASLLVHCRGSRWMELEFCRKTARSCNAFWRLVQ